ncbi:hypothetical protein [Kitasatospora sp. NBC_00458]|uniref:hypothetical protein n=1 Tax=Kitasatospora sp. NBC_00458 TaxID=2903568 RepID=UPI002E179FC3
MPDQTPADLLAAAAQRLRDLHTAATAHGAPDWTYTQHRDHPERGGSGAVRTEDGHTVAGTRASIGGRTRVPSIIRPYGEWIAAMDPALGLLIADWLDAAAHRFRSAQLGAAEVWPDDPAQQAEFNARQWPDHALAVARAVLGQDGGTR